MPESSDPTGGAGGHRGHAARGGRAGRAACSRSSTRRRPSFGAAEVIALLCAASVLAVAFVLLGAAAPRTRCSTCGSSACRSSPAEHRRVLHLLRDVRHLLLHRAVPGRGGAAPPATGWRSCSLPMTVLMIIASVLAGRWTARAGPRWSITIGCAAVRGRAAAGQPADHQPSPDYPGLLSWRSRWPASASAPPWSRSPPPC